VPPSKAAAPDPESRAAAVRHRTVAVRAHTRRVKVRPPTERQVANAVAQRKALVSQGAAVEKVARQQRSAARRRAAMVADTKGDADRRRAETFKRTAQFKSDVAKAAYAGELRRTRSLRRASEQSSAALERLQSAGAVSRYEPDPLKLFVQGQFETARATVQHPRDVLPKTAGSLAKYAVGAIPGAVEAAVHPAAAIRGMTADFNRRYGVLAKPGGAAKFRARIRKEGAAPELVEGVGSLIPTGVVGGRVAQRAAEVGALGKTLRRAATSRPDLRVSGEVVRKQPVSANLARNVARATTDTARARVQRKRAGRAVVAVEVKQAQERGEVTYVSRYRQRREQRKAIAREKGATIARLKTQQQAELRSARRDVGSLSKSEQRGIKHAMQTGAFTPQAARKTLERRIATIEDERAARRKANPRYQVSAKRDELPELRWLHEHADDVFTPRLRAVVKRAQVRERRQIHAGDPGVDPVQAQLRRHAPQAELVGVRRAEGETNAAYLRRVKQAAAREGLERPGYFPSEERPQGAFSAMAAGGQRATEIPKAYTGSLFRQGIESADPEVMHRGAMRSIKRREQWNMVSRNFERHAVREINGRPVRDQSILELTRTLENAGVDPATVGFWNPRRFYEASKQAARHEDDAADPLGQDVGSGDRDLHNALRDSIATAQDLRTRPEEFAKSRGWSVVPRQILDELESQTRSSGAVGRSFDIGRGKVSRVLLGNPAWLSFQVGSNALMTGLAGVGPVDAIKAQRWWAKLPADVKQALEPDLGIHGWMDEQTHLGASTHNRFVNAYRGFKTTGLYQSAHRANPLDAIFRADNAQNNFFRRAVAYNHAKRETYRRMGRDTKGIMRAQQSIQRVFKMDPDRQILETLRDPQMFERHAQAVSDFLGDYTTYSARERRTLGRYGMFYGFLRNALRMTFYTMPVKHPVMTAIGLQLGKLHDDELKRLFGVDVPVWEQGNAFVDGHKFDVSRLNPFFNAIEYQGPGSVMGAVSPFAAIVVDQIAGKNVLRDQPWHVGGSTQDVRSGRDVGPADRARIVLAQALNLSPYYRLATKTGIPGVARPLEGRQSDTSSLLFPQPTQYKQADALQTNEQRIREQRSTPALTQLQRALLPLLGEPSAPTIRQSREYAAARGKDVPGTPDSPFNDLADEVVGRDEVSGLDDDEIDRILKGR